jgi:transcriptional regulator with XRE-family HTH domain
MDLEGFTPCHLLEFGVSASDAVLLKLKRARVRPADLARALGVSRPMASLMLAGKRGIPTWHLDAIADLLKLEVPQLFAVPDEERDEASSRPRGADGAATAHARRVRELEGRLQEREAFIRQVQDATIAVVRLFGLDLVAAEDRATRATKRGRRGTHRKIG